MCNCPPAAEPDDDLVRITDLGFGIIGITVRRPACGRRFGGRYATADMEMGIQAQDARGAAWCKANCHG